MQISLNLVDALSHCSAEDLATLNALLDTMHFTKVYRFPFPTPEHVARLVEEAKGRFLNMPLEAQRQALFTEVARRLNLPTPVSREEWSKMLLWKAAEKYGLLEPLPPLTLAREVLKRGMLEVIRSYLNAYEKADESQRQQMRRQMEEALRRSPSHLVEELRNMASVEKMTSDALIGFMRQAIAGSGTLLTVSGLGFSAYIALSTIIHTLFTTLLGITLPFGFYMTASSALSALTGPVGWLVLGSVLSGIFAHKGKKLNRELLNMVALTALTQWYQHWSTTQEAQQVSPVVMVQEESTLPVPLKEQTTEMRLANTSLQAAERKVSSLENQIQQVLQNVRYQEQRTAEATRKANERRMQLQRLRSHLQMADGRRHDLQQQVQQAPAEDLPLRVRLEVAEEEVRRLRQEVQTAWQLAEEAQKERIDAERALQQLLAEARQQIAELQEQKAEVGQQIADLKQQLQQLKAKRKQDYSHRFQRLTPNLRFHDRALDWFAEQTDDNVLLSAERILMDINYSVYPPQGWRRISNTTFEEVHFAKDYRIYFAVDGSAKQVMLIGHKNTQLTDIEWLRRQRVA